MSHVLRADVMPDMDAILKTPYPNIRYHPDEFGAALLLESHKLNLNGG